MSTLHRTWLGFGAAVAALALYLAYGGTERPTGKRTATAEQSLGEKAHEGSTPAPSRDASESPRSAQAPSEVALPPAEDEATVLSSLRESFMQTPLEALELARKAERASPDSEHASERAWIIVRSLVNLGRFHEAREEAKLLVARDPESPFAIDVQRHLLVNPLDYPSREALQELAKLEAQP